VLQQQFIAKCILFLADWFRRPSREALGKGLRSVCEAFANGLRSICKGFEKRLTRFANRLTGVCKWFEKSLKCFPSVCEEFAKGLQSVSKEFAKRLKRCQTPFVRRFKRPKNAIFDKTCFPMEGHKC